MGAKAKVSGSVVAGFPSPAEQYLEPPLDLNELLVKRPAATYFVRVQGDSMSGAGISDGDLLVVDRSLRPADGDVIIASVDGDFTVKSYRRDKDGIRLEPANPAYPVIRLRAGQELDYGCTEIFLQKLHDTPCRGESKSGQQWRAKAEWPLGQG